MTEEQMFARLLRDQLTRELATAFGLDNVGMAQTLLAMRAVYEDPIDKAKVAQAEFEMRGLAAGMRYPSAVVSAQVEAMPAEEKAALMAARSKAICWRDRSDYNALAVKMGLPPWPEEKYRPWVPVVLQAAWETA